MPWALVGALLIVAGAEVALRAARWPARVPYELGRMEYASVAARLDLGAAAEVSIVGTSRTRESVNAPLMGELLAAHARRPVTVANYATSAAHASHAEAIVRRLLREPTPPRVILWGVSERDYLYGASVWDEVSTFWNLADWRAKSRERGQWLLDDLPVVARNHAGRAWRTLGLREPLRQRARELALGRWAVDPPSPVEGGLTVWQRSSPSRTLARFPVARSIVVERVALMTLEQFPHPALRAAVENVARDCRRAGVRLVFYEVPMSRMLRTAMPADVYAAFTDATARAAEAHGARFVRLDALAMPADDRDMREPSHMSLRGATKLTRALVDRVLVPGGYVERKRAKRKSSG